jgi:hypothetical protein
VISVMMVGWLPPGVEEAGGTMLVDGEGSLDINHILKY